MQIVKIKSIRKIQSQSKRYDIEVANNNNFFANNILVHNCSFFYHVPDKRFGVLGRTLELHEIFSNRYTDQIERYDIKNKLIEFCTEENISICLRGESYGIGIQGLELNPHSKLPAGWAMFSVYLTEERRYARKGDKYYFLNIAEKLNLPTVEIIAKDVVLTKEIIQHYSSGITELNGKPFEGVVVQHAEGSFKIINKHYDSKK